MHHESQAPFARAATLRFYFDLTTVRFLIDTADTASITRTAEPIC